MENAKSSYHFFLMIITIITTAYILSLTYCMS